VYVLDTNTLSYFFRGERRIAERLSKVSPSDVVIPTIVLFEIEAGVAKSSEAAKWRASSCVRTVIGGNGTVAVAAPRSPGGRRCGPRARTISAARAVGAGTPRASTATASAGERRRK